MSSLIICQVGSKDGQSLIKSSIDSHLLCLIDQQLQLHIQLFAVFEQQRQLMQHSLNQQFQTIFSQQFSLCQQC